MGVVMKDGHRVYFPKVHEAREVLKEKALAILERYEAVIAQAVADGKLDVAAEHLKWLIEHMPHEDGERMIDESASKPKQLDAKTQGPMIQIGIKLGGVDQTPKTLPQIVDITPEPHDD